MKKKQKPTREQKKLIAKWGKDPADWLVERDTPECMVIVHRLSDKTVLTIPRGSAFYGKCSARS